MMQVRQICIAFAALYLLNAQGFAQDPAEHHFAGKTSANDTAVLGLGSVVVKKIEGPQPGSSNGSGPALAGAAWGLRSWLGVNGAYGRAYTAASPRQQFLMGFIYTMRPGLAAPHREAFGASRTVNR